MTPSPADIPLFLLEVAIILIAARVGGRVAERVGQPSVLGEMLMGVGLGALSLIAPDGAIARSIETIRADGSHIEMFAEIGVVLLLFEVGLESRLRDIARVGWTALLVATTGVIVPFILGYIVCVLYLHEYPPDIDRVHVHLFVAATLTATSVGITVRIFKDLRKAALRECKIVLAAAVLDDVFGLLVLAVVTSLIASGGAGGETGIGAASIGALLKALAFIAGGLLVGVKLGPPAFRLAARLGGTAPLVTMPIAFCFAFAFLAHQVGLAMVVGGFAAGLVLGEAHLQPLLQATPDDGAESELRRQMRPLSALFVPVFFILVGMRVRLELFTQGHVVLFGVLLTLAAIVGKQMCSLVVRGRARSRLAVGAGMIPRGEVGLIFAAIGLRLGVFNEAVFSAVVLMVILTTLITPPVLRLVLDRLAPDQPRGTESDA